MCHDHNDSKKDATPVDEHFDEINIPANHFADPVTKHSPHPEVVVPGRVWTVRGATKVKKHVDFPATMTIIKDVPSGDLVLINTLRFDDAMNDQILALAGSRSSRIHVVRLGAYHGRYDSFWKLTYADRCTLWTLPGHKMQSGVSADCELTAKSLPVSDGSLFVFDLPRPEGVLIVRCNEQGRGRGGGDSVRKVAVFCDAVLNISSLEFCGALWRPMLRMMGFCKAVHGPEPSWSTWMVEMSSRGKVMSEYERLVREHEFESYVSGHGPASCGGAANKILHKVRPMFA